jgi:hypothetical protein
MRFLVLLTPILLLFSGILSWILFHGAHILFPISEERQGNDGIKKGQGAWKQVLLGTLGGFAGEVAAIAIYPTAESTWCRDMSAQGSYCDGQGPMVLILTVPLFAILGSCISLLWTSYGGHVPAESPRASVFSYRGGDRVLNIGFAVAVQATYWTIFTLAAYLLTRSLL